MSSLSKRATIYFDPELHRTLRLKAVATEHSISDLVNDAVRLLLAEDAEDIEAFQIRENEPLTSFEDVLRDLKQRGRL
jgi:hypothetical protein